MLTFVSSNLSPFEWQNTLFSFLFVVLITLHFPKKRIKKELIMSPGDIIVQLMPIQIFDL